MSHVMNITCDGSVAKLGSMLNEAIFNPWLGDLFSHQRTPRKEPLLAVNQKPGISMETLITDFLHFPYLYLGEFVLSLILSVCVSVVCLDLS